MYYTMSTCQSRMRPSCHSIKKSALFSKVEIPQNNF